MDRSQDCHLGDLLTTGGFPHLEITASNKRLAYECILTHDVITKRVIVLDDLRKGLSAVTSFRTSIVNLANEYPSIRELVFPDKDGAINLDELMQLIEYDVTDDINKSFAKDNMNCYIDVLAKRGKLFNCAFGMNYFKTTFYPTYYNILLLGKNGIATQNQISLF